MKKTFIGLLAIVFLSSCATKKYVYNIESKSNTNTTGTVTFTQKKQEVVMHVDVKGLTPGVHAIHIHEKADCSAPDGTSTGGHWNPGHTQHGKWDHDHYHLGDIGNLNANEKGEAKLTFKTTQWCLGCSDESKNVMGHGLIIHASADDFKTQPTGNAGGRVGCVEVK